MSLTRLKWFWLVLLVIVAITTHHIITVTNAVPLGDEWRWMRALLIPYKSGEIGFWEYITGEYAFLGHSHYLTLLSMLAIHDWFYMDFAYLAYMGIAAYLLCWLVLVRYFLSVHTEALKGRAYLGLVIISLGFFSPLSDFPWLLVMFEYIYYLIAILLLCLYDFYLRGRLRFIYFLPALVFSAIFADTLGIAAVLVVLFWNLVLSVLKQQAWKKTLLLWSVFLLLLLIQYMILGKGVSGVQPLSKSLLALLTDPLGVLHSLLSGFAQPLLDRFLLQATKVTSAHFWQWRTLIGLVGLMMTLTSLWLYHKAAGWRKSYMPVLLVLFGLVAWSSILLSRYLDGGANVFDDTRRFMRYFATYYMGIGFALSLSQGRLAARLTWVFFAVILTCFFLASYAQHRHAIHVNVFFKNAEAAIKSEPFNEEAFRQHIGLCRPGVCNSSVEYLKNNNLSVFRESSH